MSSEVENQLVDAMRVDNFNRFLELISELEVDFTNFHIEKCLHLCCSYIKYEEYLKVLLRLGVDPNIMLRHRSSTMPALHVAASSNNPAALAALLQDERTRLDEVDDTKRTALHHAVIPRKDEFIDKAKQCVQLLIGEPSKNDPQDSTTPNLNLLASSKVDIDALDVYQSTPLHYAAKYGDEEMILTLLRRGAYIGVKDRSATTPILDIGPSTLEMFLDECLRTKNAKSPHEYMYTLIFTFPFLPSNKEHIISRYNPVQMFEMACTEEHRSYCFSSEMDTLCEISQLKHMRYLLKHPVITLFLNIKWHRIKTIFYFNICFYVVFLTLLNYHIITRPSEECNDSNETGHTDFVNSSTLKNVTGKKADETKTCSRYQILEKTLLICFLSLLVLREVSQFVISCRKHVITPGNYVKLFLIIFTIASISLPMCDARQHISALTILLSWVELFLLTGNLPILSIQLEMLKQVCVTFLRFMTWYSILILGFSFSFCILLNNGENYLEGTVHSFFLDPWRSLFKTIIMMAGEFDAVDLPLSKFPVTSHIVFVAFVFLIAIVLLNLLNGLAVSDTQAIKDEAEVYSLVSRVKTISHIENSLLNLQNSRILHWGSKLPCIRLLYKNIFVFPFFNYKKEICVYPNWKEHNVVINKANDANEYFHLGNWSFKTTLNNAIQILINKKKISNMNSMKMYLELKQTQVEIQKMFDSFEERITKAIGKGSRYVREKSKKRKV